MSKDKFPATSAIRMLRENHVDFIEHPYKYEEGGGTEVAARELGVDEHQVIKTLVMEDDQKVPFVVLMHGDKQVSTKELAREIGAKSVHPCDPQVAFKHTGYMVGGISPFGTKKHLPVYVEETILSLARIYINAGRKGLLWMVPRSHANRRLRCPGVRAAVAIAAGNGFSAAVLGDGTVMTWGNRFEGALGRAPHDDNLAEPTPGLVPGVNRVRTIVAGSVHVLALTDAGTIISWGQPDFGALGRGDATVRTPVPIPRLAGVQSVAARGYTSMAVLASGRIMTWGSVRPWTRPPEEGSYDDISRLPILLWLDGLAQP